VEYAFMSVFSGVSSVKNSLFFGAFYPQADLLQGKLHHFFGGFAP
jgi:hypothetical protein